MVGLRSYGKLAPPPPHSLRKADDEEPSAHSAEFDEREGRGDGEPAGVGECLPEAGGGIRSCPQQRDVALAVGVLPNSSESPDLAPIDPKQGRDLPEEQCSLPLVDLVPRRCPARTPLPSRDVPGVRRAKLGGGGRDDMR
jgi:hypothetical protein